MKKLYTLLFMMICIGLSFAQPANDNCASPAIIANLDGTCSTVNNTGATASGFTCAGVDGTNTVWFSFTAQGPSLTISVDGPANFRPEISLLDDACNATVCIAFADGTGNYSSITLNENNILTAGVTYYFSVTTNNGAQGNFDVCLTNRVPSNCAGEDCSSPESISIPSNGTQVCINGCNTGATVGPNFSGTNCQDLPNATVWYQFTTNATTATVNVSVTSGDLGSPEFTIFRTTDCATYTTVYCEEGSGGSVSESLINVTSNTTYLIAISDVNGMEGNFELCIRLNEDQSACNTGNSLQVTATSLGSPFGGPFRPGEVVTFCYEITQWTLFNCNYLQGIVPRFGNCWDPVSFNAQGQPTIIVTPLQAVGTIGPVSNIIPILPPINNACVGQAAGTWNWFPDGVAIYNNINNPSIPNGTNIGSGWYFLSNYNPTDGRCTPLPTNPNNSFGDANFPSCAGPLSGWRVCFQLQARDISACDLGLTDCFVSIKTYADGEIGAWNNIGCTADLPTVYPATMFCCEPDTVILDTVFVCDSIQIGTDWYFSSGTATEVFQNAIGCDSFVISEFVIFESQTTNENIVECDSAFVNGNWIYNSTTISLNDFSIEGCDSTHIIDIIINNSVVTALSSTSCNPADVGINTSNFQTQFGCDSIHYDTVTLAPFVSGVSNLSSCDSILVLGNWYFNSTSFNDTISFGAANGCDSITTYNININQSINTNGNLTACDSAFVGGNLYFSSQIVTLLFNTSSGCDSIHQIDLIINSSDTTTENIATCDSILINGIWYSNSQIIINTFINSSGCDSVHSINLNIVATIVTGSTFFTCNASEEGVFSESFVSSLGCDSIHNDTILLIPPLSEIIVLSGCDSVEIVGIWYFNSTTFNDTIFGGAANGCDSITTYQITITNALNPTFTTIPDVCQNATAPILPTTSLNGISGIWSPAVSTATIGTSTYTFTPNANECANITTLDITVIENVVPQFNAVADVCQGATAPVLPTTSLNGINGTWSPAVSTATSGTFTYIFTPNSGVCATTATIQITVLDPIVPQFNSIAPVCQGSPAPVLSTTSLNGINGTWSPAVSTATPGTFTYTFTPNTGICATTATLEITVTNAITPLFSAVSTLCVNSTPPVLPTISNNGIIGSWDRPVTTNAAGTTTYFFTPDPGQCAIAGSLNITVTNPVVPTFATIGDICQGTSAPNLPVVSLNGITGVWNPSTINSALAGTTTHTFTPNPNQCAVNMSVDIVVVAPVVPDFEPFEPVCQGYGTQLPSISLNGVSGSWTPAVVTELPGTFSYVFVPSGNQCALQVSAELEVLPSDSSTIQDFTCFASEAGESITIFSNQQGCDSVVTTITTLLSNGYAVFPDFVSIRAGESFEFIINNEDNNLEFSWISTDGQTCNPPCQSYLVTTTNDITNYYFTFVDTSTGCVNNDTMKVKLEYFSELNVPNIFTPNNDGQNDVYRVYGTDLFDFSLMIFDRWGGKVFETTNINEGWDGNFKGQPLQSGVYVALIQATGLDTKKYEITQNIKLVR